MTVIAGFSVAAADIPFGQALSATTNRIELTQFVPVDESFIPYFWKERAGDLDAFERSVRDHPAVETLERVDGRVETALYRVTWTDAVDGFLDALRELDLLVERASTNHGETWFFRVRALDQTELSAFQARCFENGIGIDVHRMIHNPDPDEDHWMFAGVTTKQRDALELALDNGYFRVPRERSATEISNELGISRQAFSRRLQRGQQAVFTNLLTEFGPG